MIASAAVVATFALDTILGEPPERLHPVALFGRLVAPLDREWDHPHAVGLGIAVIVPLAVAVPLALLTVVLSTHDPVLAGVLAVGVLFSTTSLRSLLIAATTVIDATETELVAARAAAPSLVGRDLAALSAGELRSAAVESAAENLADGLVAPLAAFAMGSLVSLPVAVAGAAFVKAGNTLDSMLGYQHKSVGWASARLDDVVMWVPARISALLIVLVAAVLGSHTPLRRTRSWARRPTSPNSGWPMAAMAGALDVRLEKPDAYVLNPAGDLPTPADARRSLHIVGIAGIAAFTITGVLAWF